MFIVNNGVISSFFSSHFHFCVLVYAKMQNKTFPLVYECLFKKRFNLTDEKKRMVR